MNPKKKKIVKRVVAGVLALAVLGGIIWLVKKKGGGKGPQEIMTGIVGRGSITSVVNGSGVTLAKNSQTITILSGGMVREVYVKEGDRVAVGDALYSMDEGDAVSNYERAQRAYNSASKNLAEIRKSVYDTNIRADFAGMVLNANELRPGDKITRGQQMGTLVDNKTLKLHQYFSYAYEKEIKLGQTASVSVPSSMATLKGSVSEIRMVKRIVPEGTMLFEVIFDVANPGALTEGMEASASVDLGYETAYPYEAGKLAYGRSAAIVASCSGEVSSTQLWNYAEVSKGQILVALQGDGAEDDLAAAENAMKAAEKGLEDAKKALNSVNAKAEIEGTVLSVGVIAGEMAEVGIVAVNIADTTTMVIKAKVDEMNISKVGVGMMVDINQWGNQTFGTVTNVSLSGEYENGVSTFPIEISVDNTEGILMSGSYVDYSFTASQSDDCLLVPLQAVKYVETENGTQTVLFIRSDSEPENVVHPMMEMSDIPAGYYPVAVEVGISDNFNAEILSGVEEGTEIFINKVISDDLMY